MKMIKVVVSGAGGRMGRLLLQAVVEEDGMELAAALEGEEHPSLGRDVGELMGTGERGIVLCSALEEITGDWDVLVEFSTPGATLSHLPEATERGKGVVIGTTGFTGEEKGKIRDFSSKIPVLLSPNMIIGINLLIRTAGEIAKVLGTEYDVEIAETHHRLKKDSPSGTALKLAESIAEARGQDLEKVAVYGRHGNTGERKEGEIGVHALRGGTVAGDHTVVFAGDSERIELSHRAEGREAFVRGAIKAARFIAEAEPGLYDMQDVIYTAT